MAIPSSGAISLDTIQTVFGGANPIAMSEYYAGGPYVPASTSGTNGAVPSSGALPIGQFYGTTAIVVGQILHTTEGAYSWVAPAGVTSVSAVAVGRGGRGSCGRTYYYNCELGQVGGNGGSGAALAYRNAIPVTAGSPYTISINTGSMSGFNTEGPTSSQARAQNGLTGKYPYNACDNPGGTVTYGTGGSGGAALGWASIGGGGGGAGGYSGTGGYGLGSMGSGQGGTGGAGGGGGGGNYAPGYDGGGVGMLGQGPSGAGSPTNGGAGSGGSGKTYGGGGGGGGDPSYPPYVCAAKCGGPGAVRIIWGPGRSFPSTCTGNK